MRSNIQKGSEYILEPASRERFHVSDEASGGVFQRFRAPVAYAIGAITCGLIVYFGGLWWIAALSVAAALLVGYKLAQLSDSNWLFRALLIVLTPAMTAGVIVVLAVPYYVDVYYLWWEFIELANSSNPSQAEFVRTQLLPSMGAFVINQVEENGDRYVIGTNYMTTYGEYWEFGIIEWSGFPAYWPNLRIVTWSTGLLSLALGATVLISIATKGRRPHGRITLSLAGVLFGMLLAYAPLVALADNSWVVGLCLDADHHYCSGSNLFGRMAAFLLIVLLGTVASLAGRVAASRAYPAIATRMSVNVSIRGICLSNEGTWGLIGSVLMGAVAVLVLGEALHPYQRIVPELWIPGSHIETIGAGTWLLLGAAIGIASSSGAFLVRHLNSISGVGNAREEAGWTDVVFSYLGPLAASLIIVFWAAELISRAR